MIEEQTAYNTSWGLQSIGETKIGQRLTISTSIITKLSFILKKIGSPTGDITFTIREIGETAQEGTLIASKAWGDVSALTTDFAWCEVTFDAPVNVNQEVRILAEFSGGDAQNYVAVAHQNTDVKADEYHASYCGLWDNNTGWDCAYRYTYTLGGEENPQVGASADDAYEIESSGVMDIAGSTVQHMSYTDATARYWGAHRWVVSIPTGATITAAYVALYLASYLDANVNLHFELLAAPATFTTDANNITSRARTEASVPWIEDSMGAGWKDSPSIVTPLQELVDAYDVTTIVLIARPNTDAFKRFYSVSYDNAPTFAAKLHIEYTVAAPVVVTPSTLALTLTTYAPTIPTTVTPPALNLALITYVPTITIVVATPPTIALVLTTYAPTVLVYNIDVGEAAINRSASFLSGWTDISKGNPANASGEITSVEIFADAQLYGCKVGIFYKTNGNTLKCRSSCTIGYVYKKQTFDVSLAVEAGDYIGIYFTSMYLEGSTSGGAGIWALVGDYCNVDDEATYSLHSTYVISLYGTGSTSGDIVTPPTLALTLTSYPPDVSSPTEICIISTLELTLTTYIPTILVPIVEIPTTLSINLTTYISTITILIPAIPPTLSLVLTPYAPSALTPILATPPILELALTLYASTVSLSDNQIATPSTLALTLTAYAPAVAATANQVSTPVTLALNITTYEPDIVIPGVVTPPTLNLTLTTYVPTIYIISNPVVTIPTLDLVITSYAPEAITPRVATPTTLSLDITAYSPTPTLSDNKKAIPATLALTLVTYTPDVLTPILATPTTLSLLLTGYAPLLGKVVSPTTLALSIATYESTITTPVLATPSTLGLALTAYIINALTPRTITPAIAALILTLYSPDASITIHVVTPATLALLLTAYAPVVGFPSPLAKMLIVIMNEARMGIEVIDESKVTIELKGGG